MPDLPTGTVTFLFTDIEDGGLRGAGAAFWPRSGGTAAQRWSWRGPVPGTRLWEPHSEAMPLALARHGCPDPEE